MSKSDIRPSSGGVFESSKRLDEIMTTSSKQIHKSQKLASLEDGLNFKFEITPAELAEVVNFDQRNSAELVTALNSARFGGVAGIAKKLNSNLTTGLHQTIVSAPEAAVTSTKNKDAASQSGKKQVSDVEARKAAFGVNLFPAPPSDTVLQIIWGNIKEDPIIKILLASAVIVLVIGTATHPSDGWIDGLAILIAVTIVLTVTAANDYSKEKKFKKLLLLQSDKGVKVLRDGQVEEISSWDLLVGDIVELMPGDEVPADGLFVKGTRLFVDESPLTGESMPVKKTSNAPFVFSGCQISEGSGHMLVTGIGVKSSGGQIQEMLSEKQHEMTPLQEKLEVVALLIGKIGIAAGIFTFFGLVVRWTIDFVATKATFGWIEFLQIVEFFVVGVTVVVVAVPEGLPLAVTISLAFSMFKMIRDNCFVRHLTASETMGEATCVCTDKTGTLTENRMTVVQLYSADGTIHHGPGSVGEDIKEFNSDTLQATFRDLLCEGIALNSTCFIKSAEKEGAPTAFVGSATEGALLVFAEKLGANYEKLRDSIAKVENGQLEFSSERKRMATTIVPNLELPSEKEKNRVHVKGASEIVLDLCTFSYDVNTQCKRAMTPVQKDAIASTIKSWASDGLRTVILGFKGMQDDLVLSEDGKPQNLDTDLTFLALFGIKDPVRKEVPDAVKKCQSAGLTVRMVTGDNILTANKIAQECGILDHTGISLEGPVFREMTEEKKKEVIPRLQVLARSSPADKFALVSLLRSMGEVVAVTGDGTNDAPALKEADVGFAMGISGTQVSMNACDIVLLDDNFASIVQSIKWGRNVMDVIQRFLQFQLSVNLSAITITFFGSVISDQHESPLSAVELLWINLIMDTLGALALASEEPTADVLERQPHRRTESLITMEMIEYVTAMTIYQVTVVMSLMTAGYHVLGIASTDAKTIQALIFTTFVLMQVVNEILARQLKHELNFLKGIFKNWIFSAILCIIIGIQVVLVEGLDVLFHANLDGNQWLAAIVLAFIEIPYILLVRIIITACKSWAKCHNNKVTIMKSASSILSRTGSMKRRTMKSVTVDDSGKSASSLPKNDSRVQHFAARYQSTATTTTAAKAPTPANSIDGANHWKLERIASVALVPLLVVPIFAGPSKIVDFGLTFLLPLHCHWGMEQIIIDYLNKRKIGAFNHVVMGALYAATAATVYGLYMFNTNDVGITEFVKNVWTGKGIKKAAEVQK